MVKKRKTYDNYPHPTSVDTTLESCRFAVDSLIRRHGFSIHSRGKKTTLWRKGNYLLSQQEILQDVIDPEKVENAIYAEQVYNGRFNEENVC